MPTLIEVLSWKYPGTVIVVHDEKIIEWDSKHPQPDAVQLAADTQEYIAFQAANLYQTKREEAYPCVGDQLDAIWKLLADPKDADGLAVQAAVMNVKKKFPASILK